MFDEPRRVEYGKILIGIMILILLFIGLMYVSKSGPFSGKEKEDSSLVEKKVKKTTMDLSVGETQFLSVELYPTEENPKIDMVSSNTNVVTISGGELTAVGTGTAIVTAKVNGELRTECTVTVKEAPAAEVEIENISLNETTYSLQVDQTYNLLPTIEPSDATNDHINWTSSDIGVVSVYNGEIRGVSVGKATITATTSNGKTASCEVTVGPVPVDSISFKSNEESVTVNGIVALEVEIAPINASNKEVTWTSSNPSIASVNHGLVTGLKIGTTTIVATSGNQHAEATIHVVGKAIAISSISITPNKVTTSINKPVSLTANIKPSNATNKNVKWSSSNTSVATVDNNGLVTPKKLGTVTITAKAGGKTATAKVTVSSIKVTGVSLNKSSLSIVAGNSASLTATVSPSNAANKSVTWSSSDTSVATVDSYGKVTGKKVGTAKITVKTNDGGFTKTATVNVISSSGSSNTNVGVTGLTLDKTSVTLTAGSMVTVKATVTPATAVGRVVSWSSSNTAVATVSNGTIKGIKGGTATITASVGGKSATVKVTVNEILPTGISLGGGKKSFYTNSYSADLTTTLTATVSPSNATNKKVTWTSSNTSIATVDSSGKVTINQGVGPVTITAKTANGKTASYTITVKKKILVVITASQGNRMKKAISSYSNDSLRMNFKESDHSLYFVARSGSGVCFQTAIKSLSGLGKMGGFECKDNDKAGTNAYSNMSTTMSGPVYIVNQLNSLYSSKKSYIEPIIVYTLPGNSIRGLSCDQMTTTKYSTLASAYSKAAAYIKSTSGYTNTKVYMVSHFPVSSGQAADYYESQGTAASSRYVVSSSNKNKCEPKYISAWKYYTSGRVFKNALSSTGSSIKYVNVFASFLQVKNSSSGTMEWNPERPFPFKIYDSQHMTEETAAKYAKFMFDKVLAA